VLAFLLAYSLLPAKIEIKEKLVTKVQERVIVHTKIVERPDGTKETIIDERRDTDTSQIYDKVTRPAVNQYRVALGASLPLRADRDTVYMVEAGRRLFLDLSGGIYVRSDKEVGLTLSWSF